MWFHTIVLSVYVYIVVAFYTGGVGGLFLSRQVNISIGYVGMVFILLSMAMSSICYFWNFADHYLSYRKYFGVVGFVYSFIHLIISLTLIQVRIGLGPFLMNPENILPFYAGLASLLLLFFLTVISHGEAIRKLGGGLWRRLMRFGYLALILAVVHTAARKLPDWVMWSTGNADFLLPPFGLIMLVGTIVVILLRILMYFDIKKKNLHLAPASKKDGGETSK